MSVSRLADQAFKTGVQDAALEVLPCDASLILDLDIHIDHVLTFKTLFITAAAIDCARHEITFGPGMGGRGIERAPIDNLLELAGEIVHNHFRHSKNLRQVGHYLLTQSALFAVQLVETCQKLHQTHPAAKIFTQYLDFGVGKIIPQGMGHRRHHFIEQVDKV